MKKTDIQKLQRKEKKTMTISIRIKPQLSKWLNKEKLSPTAIFETACKELGYEQKWNQAKKKAS